MHEEDGSNDELLMSTFRNKFNITNNKKHANERHFLMTVKDDKLFQTISKISSKTF